MAQGRVDADRIRAEGDRLLSDLQHVLDEHQLSVTQRVAGSLKDYFDPDSGRFNERVERLITRLGSGAYRDRDDLPAKGQRRYRDQLEVGQAERDADGCPDYWAGRVE